VSLRELGVSLAWRHDERVGVGTLAERGGRVWFEWSSDYTGPELSPYALPVQAGALVEHDREPGRPLPGVFLDARPDGWGLKVLHRAFQARGRSVSQVSALDELAFLGARTMGALVFHPTTGPTGSLAQAVELGELAAHAREVYDDDVTDVLPELVRAGGSPGGARPKVLVGLPDDGGPGVVLGEGELPDGWSGWLVKFRTTQEDLDVGRRELAWMQMARAAGLQVAECRLLTLSTGEQAYATRRFDRGSGGRRTHLLSAAGALDVDFRHALADWQELLRLTHFVCDGDLQQVLRAYRVAVFNVASLNEDDHLKNLAFCLNQHGVFRLSPAYDLTYSPHPSGWRSTPVLGESQQVGRAHLVELGTSVGLPQRQVERVIEQVLAATARVQDHLRRVGADNAVSLAAIDAVRATHARLSP